MKLKSLCAFVASLSLLSAVSFAQDATTPAQTNSTAATAQQSTPAGKATSKDVKKHAKKHDKKDVKKHAKKHDKHDKKDVKKHAKKHDKKDVRAKNDAAAPVANTQVANTQSVS
jgi:hypothetical protein